ATPTPPMSPQLPSLEVAALSRAPAPDAQRIPVRSPAQCGITVGPRPLTRPPRPARSKKVSAPGEPSSYGTATHRGELPCVRAANTVSPAPTASTKRSREPLSAPAPELSTATPASSPEPALPR